MTHKDFTYKELVKESYHLTKKHFWFLLGVLALSVVIQAAFGRVPVLAQIVSMAVSVATIHISLGIASARKVDFDDLLFPVRKYLVLWHYFLAALLLFLMYAAGALLIAASVAISLVAKSFVFLALMAVVAVGALIYYGTRFGFFGYFIVEHENLGPVEAIKKSWHMTEGRFWKLIGYYIMFFFLNLLGLAFFLVGILFTLPLTIIAIALVYRHWTHTPDQAESRHIA